jgi:hypothetical protein
MNDDLVQHFKSQLKLLPGTKLWFGAVVDDPKDPVVLLAKKELDQARLKKGVETVGKVKRAVTRCFIGQLTKEDGHLIFTVDADASHGVGRTAALKSALLVLARDQDAGLQELSRARIAGGADQSTPITAKASAKSQLFGGVFSKVLEASKKLGKATDEKERAKGAEKLRAHAAEWLSKHGARGHADDALKTREMWAVLRRAQAVSAVAPSTDELKTSLGYLLMQAEGDVKRLDNDPFKLPELRDTRDDLALWIEQAGDAGGLDAQIKTAKARLQELDTEILRAPAVSTPTQRKVVANARVRAKKLSEEATPNLLQRAADLGYTPEDIETIRRFLGKSCELTVNFDAPKQINLPNGPKSVAELIEASGCIMNRFETGRSGGESDWSGRERVERKLFPDYPELPDDQSSAREKAERPRYASLNVGESSLGGTNASTYGLHSMALDDTIRERCTLTFDDSFNIKDPDAVATFDHMDHMLLGKLTSVDDNEAQFWMQQTLAVARNERGATKSVMDYIEVQVHGPIDIERDIKYVRAVFHESFGNPVGMTLRGMGGGKPVLWTYFKLHDQMVLEPPSGPGLVHFVQIWNELSDWYEDGMTPNGQPLGGYGGNAEYKDAWERLKSGMPPAFLFVSDPSRAQLTQLVGGRDPDDAPDINLRPPPKPKRKKG